MIRLRATAIATDESPAPDRLVTLLDAARHGDRTALGSLLESFRPYLSLFADRKLGLDLKPKFAGSDLVQMTFLEAQQAFPRFEGSTSADLQAWLERILLNNLVEVARRFRESEKRRLKREVALDKNHAPLDRTTPSKKAIVREESER